MLLIWVPRQALCADVFFGPALRGARALAVEEMLIRCSWLALCFLYSALSSRLQPSASQLLRF